MRIGVVLIPRGLLNQVHTDIVGHQLGDQLQLIQSVYRAEHRQARARVGLRGSAAAAAAEADAEAELALRGHFSGRGGRSSCEQ